VPGMMSSEMPEVEDSAALGETGAPLLGSPVSLEAVSSPPLLSSILLSCSAILLVISI
jgi:hypothetical protein